MKIYKAHRYDPVEGSLGFKWFLLKSEAKSKQNEWNEQYKTDTEIDAYEMNMNKQDIIGFLNAYCYYPDNG